MQRISWLARVRFLHQVGESMHEPSLAITRRAITVQPGTPDSLQLEEFRVPPSTTGSVLVRGLLLGVCGTDREIIAAVLGQTTNQLPAS